MPKKTFLARPFSFFSLSTPLSGKFLPFPKTPVLDVRTTFFMELEERELAGAGFGEGLDRVAPQERKEFL